jgi:hypothetical protein
MKREKENRKMRNSNKERNMREKKGRIIIRI